MDVSPVEAAASQPDGSGSDPKHKSTEKQPKKQPPPDGPPVAITLFQKSKPAKGGTKRPPKSDMEMGLTNGASDPDGDGKKGDGEGTDQVKVEDDDDEEDDEDEVKVPDVWKSTAQRVQQQGT